MSISTNSMCNCHTTTGRQTLSFHFLFFFYLSMVSIQRDCKTFTGEIYGASLASSDPKCKALFVRSVKNPLMFSIGVTQKVYRRDGSYVLAL